MFDDIRDQGGSREGSKRFGRSLVLAVILYSTLSALVIVIPSKDRGVLEEELKQVKFATPFDVKPKPELKPKPEPKPDPPKPIKKSKYRPKVKRKELITPDKIPDEKLKESDDELVEGAPPGPVDGFLDGVEGGTGTAPAPPPPPPPPPPPKPPKPRPKLKPLPAKILPPVAFKTNKRPKYTPIVLRSKIEGTVVVIFVVTKDGTVSNPRIVSGHQKLGRIVLSTIAKWRFRPATRNGMPVAYRKTIKIEFRLENA